MLEYQSHTGVTIHSMTKEIDKGNVLNQFSIPIFSNDTLSKLYKLCFEVSFILIIDTIKNYGDLSKKTGPIVHPFQESYYSYPTAKEWREFKSKGFKFL